MESYDPMRRLLGELGRILDGQTALKQAMADLDTRLQSLERAQARLDRLVGEVPSAVTRVTRANVTETLGGLQQETGKLREAVLDVRDLAGRLTAGATELKKGLDWRWDVLGFIVAALLLTAPLTAQAYANMAERGLIDLYAAFLGGITMLVLVGIVYFGLRTWRKSSPRAETG